jgi:hypothetical protein
VTFKEINHHFRHLKRGGRGWSKRLAYSSVGTKNGTTERNPNFRRIIFADGPQRPSRHHASQACSTLQQSSAVAVVSRVGAAEPTPPPRAPPCARKKRSFVRLSEAQQPRGAPPRRAATAAWACKGTLQTCCKRGRFVGTLCAPDRRAVGSRTQRRRREQSRRRTPQPRG